MNKYLKKLPYFLAALGSVLYLALIFNNNLWMDEAFTAGLINNSFRDMLSESFADTLPPLYNIAGWCMCALFGYSPVILKLTSVLPMTALLFFAAYKLSSLYGEKVSCLYLLCLCAAPHIVYYGVEIRMYSMAFCFTASAGICALECLFPDRTKKASWILFTLFTALSGYSHHYGLFAASFLWLMIFIRFLRKDRPALFRFFRYAFLAILLYLPGLILTIRQLTNASSYFSAAGGTIQSLLADLRYPFVTNISPVSALLLLLALAVIIPGFKGPAAFEGISLMLIEPLVLLCSYLIMAAAGSSFFSARYLLPALGLFWLGFCLLAALPGKDAPSPLRLLFPACVLILLLAGVITYTEQFREEYGTDPSVMTEYFAENFSENDGYLVFADDYQILICMRDYYIPALTVCSMENADEITGNLWCMAAPGHEEDVDELCLKGYEKEYIGDFSFDRYTFSLFKMCRNT